MCGLAGYWSTTRGGVDAGAMADALRHRGPDAGGVWSDPAAGISLSHRRLAIVDLSSAGAQPMMSPSGRFVTVFNGEIYNHADLRRELEAEGAIAWRGHSDTETLVHGIERWGLTATLQRAVGMWAVAVWDRRDRQLELARDRIGEKPLYWGWGAGGIVFGSELKALRAVPGFDNAIDESALALFLRYSYVPTPYSILRDIFKVEPGVVVTLTSAALDARPATPPTVASEDRTPGVRCQRYWSLTEAITSGPDASMSDRDAVDGLETRLDAAVRLQSVADVPLGVFLSGGVDSSLIAATLQKITGNVRSFTIGFSEAGFDEAPHARAIAQHIGSDHSELYVGAADMMSIIPTLCDVYDEPFADSSQIPTILVSRLARQHVTVALSGDAGDELFGGYNRYLAANRLNDRGRLSKSVGAAIGGMMTSVPPHYWDRLARLPGLPSVSMAGVKAHKLGRILASGDDARAQYDIATSTWPGALPLSQHRSAQAPVDLIEPIRDNPAERMMQWDTTSYLPDDILCKVDRASMSASLETRVPFLDHRMVEYAWRMPLHHKIRNGQGKWAVRQLLYRHVPRDLIERPKAGFAIPIGNWLRGPLRDWAEALIDEAADSDYPALDNAMVRSRWQQHVSGSHDWSGAIWSVLMVQSWRNRFDKAMVDTGRS